MDITMPTHKRNDLFGRKVLLTTPPSKYTPATVMEILKDVLPLFEKNAADADYLYRYRLGNQPELYRTKISSNEIRIPVIVNFAQEGVNFKIGYEHSQPKTYTNIGPEQKDNVEQLNIWARLDRKEEKDAEMYSWVYTAGHGYRLTLPNKNYVQNDSAPYYTVPLDPRNTFVVYSSEIDRSPILCGTRYQKTETTGNGSTKTTTIYSVYAPKRYFEFEVNNSPITANGIEKTYIPSTTFDGAVVKQNKNTAYSNLPIQEFVLRGDRKGIVESIMSLQDAYNELASDRIEAVTSHVESLIVLEGGELPRNPETGEKEVMVTGDVVEIPATDQAVKPTLKFLTNPLDQNHMHVTRDDYRQDIYENLNMPAQGGASGGDTGKAVDLRNGWADAETDAKITAKYYDSADFESLKVILEIARNVEPEKIGNLTLSDIDIKHTRERGDDLYPRVQSWDLMVSRGVPYDLASKEAGLFTDPEAAAIKIKENLKEQSKALEGSDNIADVEQVTNPDETILVDKAE